MSTQRVTVSAIRRLLEQVRGDEPLCMELGRETRFVADLGLASLELIGFVFLCEQTFDVALVGQPGLIERLQTVGEAVDALLELQAGAAGSLAATEASPATA